MSQLIGVDVGGTALKLGRFSSGYYNLQWC